MIILPYTKIIALHENIYFLKEGSVSVITSTQAPIVFAFLLLGMVNPDRGPIFSEYM